MKRLRFMLIPLLLMTLLLCSCSPLEALKLTQEPTINITVSSATQTTSTTSPASPTVAPSPTEDSLCVAFIGNSYTYFGDMPKKFHKLCTAKSTPIKLYNISKGGYFLSQHYQDMLNGQCDKLIAEADIVILQDFGCYSGPDTNAAVLNIKSLFKEGVQFYYYPWASDPSYLDDYYDIDDVELIRTDIFYNSLPENDRSYFFTNDYHPTPASAQLTALMIYCTIFNADCTQFTETYPVVFPGTTAQEQAAHLEEYKISIMQIINEHNK